MGEREGCVVHSWRKGGNYKINKNVLITKILIDIFLWCFSVPSFVILPCPLHTLVVKLAVATLLAAAAVLRLTCASTQGRDPTPVMNLAVDMQLQ